jgi:hypothetical protein
MVNHKPNLNSQLQQQISKGPFYVREGCLFVLATVKNHLNQKALGLVIIFYFIIWRHRRYTFHVPKHLDLIPSPSC